MRGSVLRRYYCYPFETKGVCTRSVPEDGLGKTIGEAFGNRAKSVLAAATALTPRNLCAIKKKKSHGVLKGKRIIFRRDVIAERPIFSRRKKQTLSTISSISRLFQNENWPQVITKV